MSEPVDVARKPHVAHEAHHEELGFWRKLLEHPAYDAFWRDQAMDRLLGARPLAVPTMIVHSLWDQEDIYGAPAVYKALEPGKASHTAGRTGPAAGG